MANLGLNDRQRIESWLTQPIYQNIKRSKSDETEHGKKMWSAALTTVDAVTPILQKFGDVFVSDIGDIEVMLFASFDPNHNQMVCAVIEPTLQSTESTGSNGSNRSNGSTEQDVKDVKEELKAKFCEVDQQTIRDMIASFLIDFPDAVFSTLDRVPLCLKAKTENKQDFEATYWVSLNRMLEMAQKGITKFLILKPESSQFKKGDHSVTQGPSEASCGRTDKYANQFK